MTWSSRLSEKDELDYQDSMMSQQMRESVLPSPSRKVIRTGDFYQPLDERNRGDRIKRHRIVDVKKHFFVYRDGRNEWELVYEDSSGLFLRVNNKVPIVVAMSFGCLQR